MPAQRIKLGGVPNAGTINDFFFRGAQPSQQGLTELKKLGVTTVVNLRGLGHGVDSERKQAESLGMRFVSIPVGGWSPPSHEQVAQFLALTHGSPSQKIFIHCKFGDDRTGVMVATYRIAENHWSAEQAIKEMHSFGFHYHWHPAMEDYVRKFPVNFATDSAFAPLRQNSVNNEPNRK